MGCHSRRAFIVWNKDNVCSLILFSLFMNELIPDMWQTWRNTYLNPSEIFILTLLFADDIIFLSDTAIGLQNQLNILYRSSEKLKRKLNFDLSNSIVFRKVGYLAAHERWFCGQNQLEVVNAYKYLGFIFLWLSYYSVLLAMTWLQEVKGQFCWAAGYFCTNLNISLWNVLGNIFSLKCNQCFCTPQRSGA